MAKPDSTKMTRRRAMAGSLGVAGLTLVTGPQAMARPNRPGNLRGKRVLVAIGEFSEDMETYYMVYRLREEGVTPVVAAKEVKRVQMVVHDFDPQFSNYTETKGHCIRSQVAYRDVDPADYDGLLIPGGRGPEEIRQYPKALDIAGYFLDNKLPLGAMCHGPQVVWAARSVKGRQMTCYHGIRPDLEMAGAKFLDRPTVRCGSLLTSRGWPDLPDFMPKFLDVLAGK